MYTITNISSGKNYDTNDGIFYPNHWEATHDKKSYLKQLIKNEPKKFEGCKIIKTK